MEEINLKCKTKKCVSLEVTDLTAKQVEELLTHVKGITGTEVKWFEHFDEYIIQDGPVNFHREIKAVERVIENYVDLRAQRAEAERLEAIRLKELELEK